MKLDLKQWQNAFCTMIKSWPGDREYISRTFAC